MEKKTECEIVQDLLLGYIDDVLNNESKKLVEKHLAECSNCQKRLEEMNADMKESKDIQEKEIDYLKRIRRKTRIKAILMTIGIIVLICFSIYMYKFIIVSNVANKAQKSIQTDNIYRETIDSFYDGEAWVTKEYFKDGKYKEVLEKYSDAGKEIIRVSYADMNSNEKISIMEKEKKVIKEKGEFQEITNAKKIEGKIPWMLEINENLIEKIGFAFVMSITTDTYDVGREYYIFKNQFDNVQRGELWVDKATGLPIREIGMSGIKEFFQGTDIVKAVKDNVREYRYEFEIVTDEDVEVPDLSGYEISEYEIEYPKPENL